MTIIRPNTKPALWWLFPWSYARTLHRAANALRALSDKQDEVIRHQAEVIESYRAEVRYLCQRVSDAESAMIRGASIPDARPIPEDCES